MAVTEGGRYSGSVVTEIGELVTGSLTESGALVSGLSAAAVVVAIDGLAFQPGAFQDPEAFQTTVNPVFAVIQPHYGEHYDFGVPEEAEFWTVDSVSTPIDALPAIIAGAPSTEATEPKAAQWDNDGYAFEADEDWHAAVYGFPDQTSDVAAALFPPDVTAEFFADALREQPWFEAQDIDTELQNDTTLDVTPQFAPPDITEPFVAQYPLAEQPWFPDQEIDTELQNDSTLDVSSVAPKMQIWIDFGDPSLLFTDTARTTPVASAGDLIRGVTDKSGNSQHLAQATTPPTYQPNAYRGLSTSRWDGSAMKLQGPVTNSGVGYPQPITRIAVVRSTEAAATSRVAIGGQTATDPAGPWTFTGLWSGWAGTPTLSDGTQDNALHVITHVFNGASSSIALEGTTTATGTTGAGVVTRYEVGSYNDGTQLWLGDICEFIDFQGILDPADLAFWTNYLITKWGVLTEVEFMPDQQHAPEPEHDYFTPLHDGALEAVIAGAPVVANDGYIAALDLTDQQDFSEPEWEYGPLIDEQEELIAGPPDADHITQAAQPHYGELPIPEDETQDYANDATVDTSWAMDFASGDEVTSATEPLAEQPWFPDQDIDTELDNDTTLDVAPLTIAPDAFDLTIATQPLSEQPWFEAPDIDSEADNDTAIEVLAQLFAPDVTDEFQAAQYALPEQPWYPEQETEDYDDSSTLDVAPAFAPPLFIADAEGAAATQVFEQDIANNFPDPDPTNDQPLVDGAVEALQSPNDSFDTTLATQPLPGDDTWTVIGEDPFIPESNVEQNEFLALTADDGYIASLDILPQPFDEDPEQPDIFIEHATVAFLAGDDGYIAAQDLPDQWADALDETPEQPDTPLDTEWAQALALTDAVIAAVHHLAVEVDAHFVPEPEIAPNLSTTEVVAQLFPPPPPSGTGPDVFTAILRPRWHASTTLRWAASSKPRWTTSRIRARWLARLRSRIG